MTAATRVHRRRDGLSRLRVRLRTAGLALAVGFTCAQCSRPAATPRETPLVLAGATVTGSTVQIDGRGFRGHGAQAALPSVLLGGGPNGSLRPLVVRPQSTDTVLVAELPTPRPTPGSYRLLVRFGGTPDDAEGQSAVLDIAIGSADSAGASADAAEVQALQSQLRALAAGQLAMQKQLEELRTIAARGAAPAAPPAVAVVNQVIDIGNAQARGEASARVALVEFSDFECPFCGRFTTETLPQLFREYVETGKVRYVFRNLPLESIHPDAFRAAVAGECAGEQQRFWTLHDALFTHQNALTPDGILTDARTAGLDLPRFQQCEASAATAARVRADESQAGQVGANSTPTMFVGIVMPDGSKVRAVRIIRGAQPYETFKAAIDGVLDSVNRTARKR